MNKNLTINLKINIMHYMTNIYYIMHYMTNIYYIMHYMTNILILVYVEVIFS